MIAKHTRYICYLMVYTIPICKMNYLLMINMQEKYVTLRFKQIIMFII